MLRTYWLDAAEWLAVLRIGLGVWWLESVRHKNHQAWIQRDAGINWALDIASKHRWGVVRATVDKTLRPHPKFFTAVVLLGELACGIGLVAGFLTPVALVGSMLLNLVYFTLMVHDWAEQGQNSMMFLIAFVCFATQAWQAWSLDKVLGLFGT